VLFNIQRLVKSGGKMLSKGQVVAISIMESLELITTNLAVEDGTLSDRVFSAWKAVEALRKDIAPDLIPQSFGKRVDAIEHSVSIWQENRKPFLAEPQTGPREIGKAILKLYAESISDCKRWSREV
jgi:hypothetical protein